MNKEKLKKIRDHYGMTYLAELINAILEEPTIERGADITHWCHCQQCGRDLSPAAPPAAEKKEEPFATAKGNRVHMCNGSFDTATEGSAITIAALLNDAIANWKETK